MRERMVTESSGMNMEGRTPTAQTSSSINSSQDSFPASEAQIHVRSLMVDADEEDDTRIHLAALCGDEEGLSTLLNLDESKPWINFRVRPFQASPLRLAVTGGNISCVELLIASGVEVDLEDIKAQTPLFVATSLRNLRIMEVLLKSGANPMGNPRNLSTTVLLAVRDGFADGLELLLQYGANVDPTVEYLSSALRVCGWPLHHSIVYAHFSCFLALVQNGASPHLTQLTDHTSTIQRLSIPHTIAKYAKKHPEFVRLYHDIEGDLLQKSLKGTSVREEYLEDQSPALKEMQLVAGEPLSLKASCRLRIRQLVGRTRLPRLKTLDIPATLRSYLNFEEYQKYASKTEENLHTKLKTSGEDVSMEPKR